MIARARVGFLAALVTLASIFFAGSATAFAADKAFKQADLDAAAINLESQIKSDAGSPAKPLAQLRRDADAAFQKNDVRNGVVLLGQIIAAAPNESANWLRFARATMLLWSPNERERRELLERAETAAYIAYQRAGNRNEEADSLTVLGRTYSERRIWRPALNALRLSLELREVADTRALYEKMREDHGFRMVDYSIDSDAASPRACFQFSEHLPAKRTDFSPFVAVAGMDKPALSAEDKQLCVEGLKHGERYSVTLRAGLPSTVRETLSKSADLTIYVRDRKPFARFAGKAYVLPRTGQRGIPVVSVNTRAVNVTVYRISDRNLVETVLGREFQRNLESYEIERLTESRAIKVWSGELAVEQTLNTDVTTAFPVDQAVSDMQPGVYVMTADVKGNSHRHRRFDLDPVVHRLRHGAFGLFRQRRHQRVRQFARHHGAEGPDRSAADVARQRGARHQAQRRAGPRAVRGRAFPGAKARLRPPCWSPPTRAATTASSTSRARRST